MKLPNNFGSVVKLSGNRRRPFMVRKTIGYTDSGRPIQKSLGYFDTYSAAVAFLENYNRRSLTEAPGISLLQLYRQWLPRQQERVGASALEGYRTSLIHLRPIVAISIDSLKFHDVQACFDNMHDRNGNRVGYATKKKARTLLNRLLQYGRINELIPGDINFGKDLDIGINTPIRPHSRFTRQQINKVWKSTMPEKDIVLLLLYTGMRISELLNLKKKNVKLRSKYFDITQSKTAAGIRIIPIHDSILPLVINLMMIPGKYLIPDCRTYATGADRFNKVMKALKIKHSPHDCRHTVRSILNEKDANQAAIDRLLGHCSKSIGDAVYTHVRLPQLRKTLRLLP